MDFKLTVMVMSGVQDGSVLEYDSHRGDGRIKQDRWVLTIGRRDDNDICLRNDTYISRHHADLCFEGGTWHIEDCESTNGTFINNIDDFFDDQPVTDSIHIQNGQLFRVGRTWLKIQS